MTPVRWTPKPLSQIATWAPRLPPQRAPNLAAWPKTVAPACLPRGLQRPRTVAVRAQSNEEAPLPPAHMALALGGAHRVEAARALPHAACAAAVAHMRQHADPMARRDFVVGLAQNAGAGMWLGAFMDDPSHLVRQAITGVAQAPQTAHTVALLATLGQDRHSMWVRQQAAHALAQLAGPAAQQALCTLCCDPDAWVRLTAVHGLRHARSDAATDALLRCLTDSDAWVRGAALQGLPAGPASRLHSALARMALRDGVPWLRHAALRSLALRDPWQARLTWVRMPKTHQGTLAPMFMRFASETRWMVDVGRVLENDFSSDLQHSARPAEAFEDVLADPRGGEQAHRAASKALRELATRALLRPEILGEQAMAHAGLLLMDPTHPVEVAVALGSRPHACAAMLPVLEMLRHSDTPHARRTAANVLACLPASPHAVPMLATLVDDPDAATRAAVATALGKLLPDSGEHRADAIAVLGRLLLDPDATVRKEAVEALRFARGHDVVPLLIMAAHDCSEAVRHASIAPLSDYATDETAHVLHLLATDVDVGVRQEVARMVEHLPVDVLYDSIAALAADAHPHVRETLVRALQRHASAGLQNPMTAEMALRWLDHLDHPDEDTSRAVHITRSKVLGAALEAFAQDPAVLHMLHTWAQTLRHADAHGLEAVATCNYSQRHHVLTLLLDSPHESVRQAAQAAIARQLRKQFRVVA